jgi:hypothetical protein
VTLLQSSETQSRQHAPASWVCGLMNRSPSPSVASTDSESVYQVDDHLDTFSTVSKGARVNPLFSPGSISKPVMDRIDNEKDQSPQQPWVAVVEQLRTQQAAMQLEQTRAAEQGIYQLRQGSGQASVQVSLTSDPGPVDRARQHGAHAIHAGVWQQAGRGMLQVALPRHVLIRDGVQVPRGACLQPLWIEGPWHSRLPGLEVSRCAQAFPTRRSPGNYGRRRHSWRAGLLRRAPRCSTTGICCIGHAFCC